MRLAQPRAGPPADAFAFDWWSATGSLAVPLTVRGSRRWLAVAVVLLLGGPPLLTWWLRPSPGDSPCVVATGPVPLLGLEESSGLAVSRRTPGVLWTHNDSGNDTTLFAIDASGAILGRIRVPVRTRDWEDVSAAPCEAGSCLYIADIGDNRGERGSVRIHRVPEPAPADAETAAPESFEARYEDGPHNAEAMFVLDSALFIVTRDREGAVYRTAVPSPGERLTFRRIGALGLEAVTDAETSRDGATVVVRTSDEAVLYRGAALLRGVIEPAVRIPIGWLREAQGEGVALDGSTLYLSSEAGVWSGGGRLLTLDCTLP